MNKKSKTQLFQNQNIRAHWDEENEKWFFSVQDIVQILSESNNVKQYIKKMRSRNTELNTNWGTICTPLEMIAADGKKRKIQAANTEGILRIIQSIPSPKAEPFKLWLAKVGAERISETEDPELAFDRAMATYLKKGYSKSWINQRLKSIEIRKDLTDEWQQRGIKKGLEYAILPDEITKAWTGKSIKNYKKLKGLKQENLRDNMSNLELVLNMLAKASKGGGVAQKARLEIEKQTGKKVISGKNFQNLLEGKRDE
jgi:prophage antirepressor-like protein